MSADRVARVILVLALAGCGGGYYDYESYSPAAVGAGTGIVSEASPADTAKPPAGETAVPKATPLPADPAAFVRALPDNPSDGVTDGLVRSRDWKVLNWANPGEVSPWKKTKGGDDVVLVVKSEGGDYDKTAISRPIGIVARADGELRLDVYNGTSREVPLAFAVFASVDRVYSESTIQPLKPGWNHVVFDLSAATFKSAASEWKNEAKLWGADDIREIAVLFYDDAPAIFAVDGIEVDGTIAEATQ